MQELKNSEETMSTIIQNATKNFPLAALSKGLYIPWAVSEDSGYWLNGVLRGWSANG